MTKEQIVINIFIYFAGFFTTLFFYTKTEALTYIGFKKTRDLAHETLDRQEASANKKEKREALKRLSVLVGEKQNGFWEIGKVFKLKQDPNLYKLPENIFRDKIGLFEEMQSLAISSIRELISDVFELRQLVSIYKNESESYSMMLSINGMTIYDKLSDQHKHIVDRWSDANHKLEIQFTSLIYKINHQLLELHD